jgi:hypothetical protein
MRPTTVWSILFGAGWLFLNLRAKIVMLTRPSDEALLTATGIQHVSMWFLIAAIVFIALTGWENLFGLPEGQAGVDANQARLAAKGSTGGTPTDLQSGPGGEVILNEDHLKSLHVLTSFLIGENSDGARRGKEILGKMELELGRGRRADRDKVLGCLSRVLIISENLGPTVGPLDQSIQRLKSLCAGSEGEFAISPS